MKTSAREPQFSEKTQELIQKRAYEISQSRGCTAVIDLQDWFEAEKQIRRELRLAK